MKPSYIQLGIAALIVLTGFLVQPALASHLEQAKRQQHNIQNQISLTRSQISQQKQNTATLSAKVKRTHQTISTLSTQIQVNDRQTQAILDHIIQINGQIGQNEARLKLDQQQVEQMVRAEYEYGGVSYLEVLFNSTSFSDLLSRLNALTSITQSQQRLVNQTQALMNTLAHERVDQRNAYHQLVVKGKHLSDLKQQQLILVSQQQHSLRLASRGLNGLLARQQALSERLHMTQAQIREMEQQTRDQSAILATNVPLVVEPELRYHSVSPQRLYDFVHARRSTFSLGDIETICAAARRYDVNPALMVAITGQEEAFVPPGPNASKIRNNPFNVYYSWQVYNTNLDDSANIAANTLRHKLSVTPPAGEDAILWINDPRNPWGIYATDTQWAYGVRTIYHRIMSSVG